MGKEDKHRHFTREFKVNAVQLVTEKGMPVGKVAQELDIHPNLLHLWRRRLREEGDKAFVWQGPSQAGERRGQAAAKGLEKDEGREGTF